MESTSQRSRRVDELVTIALGMPEKTRGAYLDTECDSDTALRNEVEARLLQRTELDKTTSLRSDLDGTHTTRSVARTHDADKAAILQTDSDTWNPVDGMLVGPRMIGRFTALNKIGQGGMGAVYAAYDEKLDRKIAVKVLRRGDRTGKGRKRLVREAQAMARLSHPNVAPIYEVGEVDDRVFIAMEYIPGETLRDWHIHHERTSFEILAMYLQAGRGLAAAHDAGIIHRDFKPSNVLVGDDQRARVLDFGLARTHGVAETTTHDNDENNDDSHEPGPSKPDSPPFTPALAETLTRAGAIMGTPKYMSPEQLQGHAVDAQSDQYNFCVALYEALFGVAPFEYENFRTNLACKLKGRIHPPAIRIDELEPARNAIVRGLAVNPEQRWSSMTELLDCLQIILSDHDRRAFESQGRQALWFFSLLGLASLVSAIIYLALIGDPDLLTPRQLLNHGAGSLAGVALLAAFVRPWLVRNPTIRRFVHGILMTMAMIVVHRALSLPLDTANQNILLGDLLIVVATIGTAALNLTPWLWLPAAHTLALATLGALRPSLLVYCVAFIPTAIFPLSIAIWFGRRTPLLLAFTPLTPTKRDTREWTTRSTDLRG